MKNPTGFNQVIDILSQLETKITALIALNDNIADGTDVSWIWDVDFELLTQFCQKIIITGDRVDDLAIRLKYTEYNLNQLIIRKSKQKSIDTLINQSDKNIYVLPTYTALWQLRDYLLKIK